MGNEDFDEVIKILGMMARSVQKKRFYIVNAFIFRMLYLLIPSLSTGAPSSVQKKIASHLFIRGRGCTQASYFLDRKIFILVFHEHAIFVTWKRTSISL